MARDPICNMEVESRLLSSKLSMEAKHTIFAQKNAKNNLNLGPNSIHTLWSDQQGQDIAEYAVMLAVILVLVVGTIRLVGSNANNVFSSVASSVH
jgi:Flp pilus assembly pilin Flp